MYAVTNPVDNTVVEKFDDISDADLKAAVDRAAAE